MLISEEFRGAVDTLVAALNERVRTPVSELPVIEQTEGAIVLKFKKRFFVVSSANGTLTYYCRETRDDAMEAFQELVRGESAIYPYEDAVEMVEDLME